MPRNTIIPYNPKLKQFARDLRNNSTLSEVLLWRQIKGQTLKYEFHRQVPIDEFIVDFYCHELKLAIEIDGDSHNDILKPVWFLAFQKTKSWLQLSPDKRRRGLYSGKIVFGFSPKTILRWV